MTRPSLALVAVIAIGCAAPQRQPQAPPPNTPVLRVMTYNVNYGLVGDPETVDAIRAGNANLVLIQESTEPWEEVLRAELGSRYAYIAFHHCCGAGGLGILSQYPFSDPDVIEPPDGGWFPASRVIVEGPLGPLQVLNVHLRPAVSESGSVVSGYLSTPPIRKRQMERFYAAIDPSLPTLIVGDFNEGDGGRAIGFLRQRGFRSALPEFEAPQKTWHWNTSVGTVSAQLDHIVYDDRLAPLDVHVLYRGRSDHFPVVGVFRTAPKKRTDEP